MSAPHRGPTSILKAGVRVSFYLEHLSCPGVGAQSSTEITLQSIATSKRRGTMQACADFR